MKKSLVLVIILMVILSTVLAGCTEARQQASAPQSSQQQAATERVVIASASAGGTFYAFAAGFATLLKDNLGVKVVDITNTGGAINVVKVLNDGKTGQMGATADPTAYAGWNGDQQQFQGTKYQNIRLALPLYTSLQHVIVKANSPIKTLADLNGKVVQIGEPGMSYNLRSRETFTALGIKPAKLVEAPAADALNMFQDNQIDCMIVGGYLPEPSTANIDATQAIRFIPYTNEEIQKIIAMYPYLFKAVIPANTYKAAKTDVLTIANSTSWYVNKDMSTDFVYNMVKQAFDNKTKLAAAAAAAKDLDPKAVLQTGIIPLHPGALKYFKEVGLNIPDKLIAPESR